jgi:hypothetical protein
VAPTVRVVFVSVLFPHFLFLLLLSLLFRLSLHVLILRSCVGLRGAVVVVRGFPGGILSSSSLRLSFYEFPSVADLAFTSGDLFMIRPFSCL